jgi:serine/threonine protein phosphatase PrpC
MKIEAYAASLPQDGGKPNEDAWLIVRGEIPCVAVCDGAGNAQRAAHKTLALFEKYFKASHLEEISSFPTWNRWVRSLDSALLGATETTFVAVSVLEGRALGACAGDSRLYHWSRDGKLTIPSEGASKKRVGSGEVEPAPVHFPLQRGDVLLLLSDGAWTPLNLTALRQVVARGTTRHLSELPTSILDLAGRTGRADDMTAVVLKVL